MNLLEHPWTLYLPLYQSTFLYTSKTPFLLSPSSIGIRKKLSDIFIYSSFSAYFSHLSGKSLCYLQAVMATLSQKCRVWPRQVRGDNDTSRHTCCSPAEIIVSYLLFLSLVFYLYYSHSNLPSVFLSYSLSLSSFLCIYIIQIYHHFLFLSFSLSLSSFLCIFLIQIYHHFSFLLTLSLTFILSLHFSHSNLPSLILSYSSIHFLSLSFYFIFTSLAISQCLVCIFLSSISIFTRHSLYKCLAWIFTSFFLSSITVFHFHLSHSIQKCPR